LIMHLGYKKAIIVAHDWGGAICWNLAIAFPGIVEKLIIINSPHPYLFAQALARDPVQQASSEYMNWLRNTGSEKALAKNDFALTEGFFSGMGQAGASWFDEATRKKYHECWSRGLLGGVNYYRASPLYPPNASDQGAAKLHLNKNDFLVNVPTRVIWGEMDKALPESLLDGLETLVADLAVIRVADGSHWIIHEQTDIVNSHIHQFLKS
jgi:pimeloyl-ACP methyl ester carboxylesterase